jgi:hypothetical protein
MLSEDEDFVFILQKERKKHYQSYTEFLDHNGKWIIYGPKGVIEGLGSKMIDLVGRSNILEAKFTRNPALKVPEGFELGRDYALIVYCDDRKNKSVKRKLKEEPGVDKMLWKYDRETLREASERNVHD